MKEVIQYWKNEWKSVTDQSTVVDSQAINSNTDNYGKFIDEDGKIIGYDNNITGKLYLIKTTEKSFFTVDNDNNDVEVPGANLSKYSKTETIEKIKNTEGAFTLDHIAYKNCIEIESSYKIRLTMRSFIEDNSLRGSLENKPKNHIEYSGIVNNIEVHSRQESEPGSPRIDNLKVGEKDIAWFHSHPSGDIGNGGYYGQPPSPKDLTLFADKIGYVFGMRNKIVYVFRDGIVQAKISMDNFLRQL